MRYLLNLVSYEVRHSGNAKHTPLDYRVRGTRYSGKAGRGRVRIWFLA